MEQFLAWGEFPIVLRFSHDLDKNSTNFSAAYTVVTSHVYLMDGLAAGGYISVTVLPGPSASPRNGAAMRAPPGSGTDRNFASPLVPKPRPETQTD